MSGEKKRYYRKKTELFLLLDKIKLWPSKQGVLHGIKEIDIKGEFAVITTHCGETFMVRNSRHSRASRWLRNKWIVSPCKACRIPDWKLEKYSKTFFSEHFGSTLQQRREG